mmetsp:Transcript_53930/g.131865  ORF Transcript_53930/g.131865 Transcript_53930/m.131865 type:complete len:289 (+) Transcript_53930:398-1264(+)
MTRHQRSSTTTSRPASEATTMPSAPKPRAAALAAAAAVSQSSVPVKKDDSLGYLSGDDGLDGDFSITPRRKAGQPTAQETDRAPVILTRELLESYFCMSLNTASRELGICATAIKKVCRKMGIKKWPYREKKGNLNRMKSASRKRLIKAKSDDHADAKSESPTELASGAFELPLHTKAQDPAALDAASKPHSAVVSSPLPDFGFSAPTIPQVILPHPMAPWYMTGLRAGAQPHMVPEDLILPGWSQSLPAAGVQQGLQATLPDPASLVRMPVKEECTPTAASAMPSSR